MATTIRYIIYFPSLAIFIGCNNPKAKIEKIPSNQNLAQSQAQIKDGFSIFDTTITLKNIAAGENYKGPKLTEKLAEKVLYKHFIRKGGHTRRNIPDTLLKDDAEPMIIEYESIYTLNLNGDKYEDAIITYWWGPSSLNGHCFQPSHAVITNSNISYEIANEGFLSDDFHIDSIKIIDSQNLIFGEFSNCGGHFNLYRNFKLNLKVEQL